jgi:inositol-hexakisphosphate/diphosphoinositol-pentakisphosphate 1-kinase
VENWPRCDVLISFFSTDFPLDKAIAYTRLRDVCCVNDLIPQALLWDRRLVGQVLDHLGVPTPPRCEVSRDGGPKVDKELREHMKNKIGVKLGGFQVTPEVSLREDGDAIIVDGKVLEKPFVEKPVSGEDHNVYIYFKGGGGRRLFRKVRSLLLYRQGQVFTAETDWEQVERIGTDVESSQDGWVVYLREVRRNRQYGGYQGVHCRIRVHACRDEEVSGSGWTRAEKPRGERNSVSRTWDNSIQRTFLPLQGHHGPVR